MLKKNITAIIALEGITKDLQRQIVDKDRAITKVRTENRYLEEELKKINATIGQEVKSLRKQTEFVRELKERLEDIVMSAEGTPTIYTGIAYIVKLLNEIKDELLRKEIRHV